MFIENNALLYKFDKALQKLGEDIPEERLTEDDILRLHSIALERYGGKEGIRDNDLFKSACVSPYQGMFGEDLYPTVFDKAAKFLLDFCRYQIFVDGNKRTGVLSMQAKLLTNGYDVDMTNEEMYDVAINIANNKITEVSEIVSIIKPRCKFLEDIEEENIKDRD